MDYGLFHGGNTDSTDRDLLASTLRSADDRHPGTRYSEHARDDFFHCSIRTIVEWRSLHFDLQRRPMDPDDGVLRCTRLNEDLHLRTVLDRAHERSGIHRGSRIA
jgi:hypothetical protein